MTVLESQYFNTKKECKVTSSRKSYFFVKRLHFKAVLLINCYLKFNESKFNGTSR